MKLIIVIVACALLTGCGLIQYRTEVWIEEEKRAEVRSNVPTKATFGELEVDQRQQSMWERIFQQRFLMRETER